MSKTKKMVFLSGPMRGIPREESRAWRELATKLLIENFETIHAFRGREKKETFSDPRGAVIRDKVDIINSDILLVNDGYPNASMIGTSMEVLLAWQLQKPVIIFGEGHPKDYWLNFHSHLRFLTLEEACDCLNKLLK